MIKTSSKIDAKIDIEKNRFRGRPTAKKSTGLVARRGLRGDVDLPPGDRRFGRKEEKKTVRKKKRKKRKFEVLKISEVFYTP